MDITEEIRVLREIIDKCENYWNERGLCDEEFHCILDFIRSRAVKLIQTKGGE